MRKVGWLALALVVLGLVALASRGAGAGPEDKPAAKEPPDPAEKFKERLDQIQATVDRTNQIVQTTLENLDYSSWSRAQNDYSMCLTKAVMDIERACGDYMIATIAARKPLDRPVLNAIDAAATEAGNLARHHIVVGAYATLTRRGVRYDKKKDALGLMSRQGIYALDAGAIGNLDDGQTQRPMENPMTGKVPGNPEAADALSRWQQAYMKANSMSSRVTTLEREIEGLPDSSQLKPRLKETLADTRRRLVNALKDVEEWQGKYYQNGGK